MDSINDEKPQKNEPLFPKILAVLSIFTGLLNPFAGIGMSLLGMWHCNQHKHSMARTWYYICIAGLVISVANLFIGTLMAYQGDNFQIS